MHRLVQAVVRHQLDADRQQRWAATALCPVCAGFPAEHTNPNAWLASAWLLPHVLAASGHTEPLGIQPEDTAWLLNEGGAYLGQRADFRQARGRAVAGGRAGAAAGR